MITDVHDCARCEQIHIGLEFYKFTNPITDTDETIWDYWCLCPLSGEPILLKSEVKDGIQNNANPPG